MNGERSLISRLFLAVMSLSEDSIQRQSAAKATKRKEVRIRESRCEGSDSKQ